MLSILCFILPPEIVDRIRKEAVSKIRTKKDIVINKDQNSLIETLKEQIHRLFQFVNVNNKYVWPGLLIQQITFNIRSHTVIQLYSYGSDEHSAETIQYVYDAFVKTTGSIASDGY